MNGSELFEIVASILRRTGFAKRGGLLRRASSEVVCLVELQKERWSELRYVNVGLSFADPLLLAKSVRTCDVSIRLDRVSTSSRTEVLDVFDLGIPIDDELRRVRVEAVAVGLLIPWCERASTVNGICEMVRERDGSLPAAFLTLVARRFLSKRCDWISAEPN